MKNSRSIYKIPNQYESFKWFMSSTIGLNVTQQSSGLRDRHQIHRVLSFKRSVVALLDRSAPDFFQLLTQRSTEQFTRVRSAEVVDFVWREAAEQNQSATAAPISFDASPVACLFCALNFVWHRCLLVNCCSKPYETRTRKERYNWCNSWSNISLIWAVG